MAQCRKCQPPYRDTLFADSILYSRVGPACCLENTSYPGTTDVQATTSIAKQCYLDILTDALMVRQLQPWHANQGRRQVKSPKMCCMFDIQTKKAHISVIMKPAPAPGALLAARIPPTPVSPPRRMERSSIPGSCRTPRHLSGRAGRVEKRREQRPALQCDSQCARVERRKFDEGQSRPPAYFPGRSGGFRPIVHKSTEQQFFLLYTCTRILP
jgi:hypothetical protein